MTRTTSIEFGIAAIGMAIPEYAMPLSELASIRDIDSSQYTETLGCEAMALCGPNDNVVSLGVHAAKRALQNWGKSLDNIGLVVVATESSIDLSRPLSAWIMSELNLRGNIRAYEVKHACYGGTVAIRQALEWKIAGNSHNKAALVIATDVAMYAPNHSGEPTQGAGAIALIIDEPKIAAISPISYYWSEPQFDFWRPIHAAYPEVNGRLSLTSYINATLNCFQQLAPQPSLGNYLNEFAYICMHVPFPKMVAKAYKKLGNYCGYTQEYSEQQYTQKVFATMKWNQQIGNSYTASLWFAVANALTKMQPKQELLAFSYGSGCGSEILTLQCTNVCANALWQQQLEQDLAARTVIDANFYQEIRDNNDITI